MPLILKDFATPQHYCTPLPGNQGILVTNHVCTGAFTIFHPLCSFSSIDPDPGTGVRWPADDLQVFLLAQPTQQPPYHWSIRVSWPLNELVKIVDKWFLDSPFWFCTTPLDSVVFSFKRACNIQSRDLSPLKAEGPLPQQQNKNSSC